MALEKEFPCLKIDLSFKKSNKPQGICYRAMRFKKVSSLKDVWSFLGEHGISYTEMMTLYKGVKMLDQISETNPALSSNNDKPFIKEFGGVYAKVLLIGSNTKSNNRITLSTGSSTC